MGTGNGQVTDHGFSAHSRRPWDCRICKRPAEIHTTASTESLATWRNAKTAEVTDRMKRYSDRTVGVLRAIANLGGKVDNWDLNSRGWHKTAVKILKDDAILINTTPGEAAAVWEISPVGAQVCFNFDIVIANATAYDRAPESTEDTQPEPAQADDMTVPTNTPVIAGYHWKRHTQPGQEVWAGSTYQLIHDGTTCQVAATVKHLADGRWQAQSCWWGGPTITRDFWAGESLADAFAGVVAWMDYLARAQAAGVPALQIGLGDWRTWVAPSADIAQALNAEVDALIAEHDAAMDEWAKPLIAVLPTRTPGEFYSLDIAEEEIASILADSWHGTGTCVNCGCDPNVPVFSLNPSFRFKLNKRARKAAKRSRRNRVGA